MDDDLGTIHISKFQSSTMHYNFQPFLISSWLKLICFDQFLNKWLKRQVKCSLKDWKWLQLIENVKTNQIFELFQQFSNCLWIYRLDFKQAEWNWIWFNQFRCYNSDSDKEFRLQKSIKCQLDQDLSWNFTPGWFIPLSLVSWVSRMHLFCWGFQILTKNFSSFT